MPGFISALTELMGSSLERGMDALG
jgi:hypothetical protein